jgi:hypothetical protein
MLLPDVVMPIAACLCLPPLLPARSPTLASPLFACPLCRHPPDFSTAHPLPLLLLQANLPDRTLLGFVSDLR